MVKTLSKTAEDRLIKALNLIVDQTNKDVDPNEAIAKTASDLKIPHGHIQLIVNAYNTGRSTAQRRSSDDIWTKAAEFPIADTGKILEILYPDTVKTASQTYNETAVSEDYNKAPGWVDRLYSAQVKKAENINWKLVDKPEPYPSEDNSFSKAKTRIKIAETQLQEARYRAAYAFDIAIKLKEDIKEYFKTANAEPFNAVQSNAIALHGDEVRSLFKQLLEENPKITGSTSHRQKTASDKQRPAIGPVYSLIVDCLEASRAYGILREDFETKEASFDSFKEDQLRPFVQDAKSQIGSPESVLGEQVKAGALSKRSGFFGSFAENFKGKQPAPSGNGGAGKPAGGYAGGPLSVLPGMKSPWGQGMAKLIDMHPAAPGNQASMKAKEEANQQMLKDRYKSQYEYNPDDELEQQFNALQQESMLSDLMANDEVLSQRDPHEILNAYSSLRQIAPRASANRETLKALLRDRLERGGATSIFDINTLTQVEKTLRDIEGRKGQEEQPMKG